MTADATSYSSGPLLAALQSISPMAPVRGPRPHWRTGGYTGCLDVRGDGESADKVEATIRRDRLRDESSFAVDVHPPRRRVHSAVMVADRHIGQSPFPAHQCPDVIGRDHP